MGRIYSIFYKLTCKISLKSLQLQALSVLNEIETILPVQLPVLCDTVKLLCSEGIQLP